MSFWARLSRKYTRGSIEGQHVLNTAYRDTFSARASKNQTEMVLSDMAARCGWNQVTTPETAEQRIWFNEGKRAAYAFIFARLAMSSEDIAAFENAIRHDTQDLNTEQ